ncbi:aminoglycoside phosphotransferase family protein [Sulfurimonas sp.]
MDKIKNFLQTTPYSNFTLSIASADASFRKYYRLSNKNESYLLMDSSLEKESLAPFIDVTQRLQNAGVKSPEILLQDLNEGYLIIEDFGDKHLLSMLNRDNFKELYTKAIDIIVKMQTTNNKDLPLYSRDFLHFEMDLMQEWYIQKMLGITLSSSEKSILQTTLKSISNVVLYQPQNVFVHRDYHSRNIMVCEDNSLGIIDYQDAMRGAITYDLVSLLKDCYIAFEQKDIESLALYFRDKVTPNTDDEEFLKWFDFMGMQRHIKVLGIFSRLHLRDAKDGYLKDIPLTLSYTLETASRYKETKEFADLLRKITQ